jgi:hypothetical protein
MNYALALIVVGLFLTWMIYELGWGGGTHEIENSRTMNDWRAFW